MFALIQCVNGNFKVLSEHGTNFEEARTSFYSACATLSNAPDVITSQIMVVNEYLQPVGGLSANIGHDNAAAE